MLGAFLTMLRSSIFAYFFANARLLYLKHVLGVEASQALQSFFDYEKRHKNFMTRSLIVVEVKKRIFFRFFSPTHALNIKLKSNPTLVGRAQFFLNMSREFFFLDIHLK